MPIGFDITYEELGFFTTSLGTDDRSESSWKKSTTLLMFLETNDIRS